MVTVIITSHSALPTSPTTVENNGECVAALTSGRVGYGVGEGMDSLLAKYVGE
jgi:hypothetical protein